ncbi:MAG: FixH family protein [Betaproteobacteria bacterium]|nr:FixH family protein [Betaproteobacteria bacterium]
MTGGSKPARPWYRESWPWLLMAGPAAVALAGIVTVWLAVSSSDGHVSGGYDRHGRALERTLTRDRAAAALGLSAELSVDARGRIEARLAGGRVPPPALQLTLVHPTRSGRDVVLSLASGGAGTYRAGPAALPAGRWLVILEDEMQTWRLAGEWSIPASHPLVLAPRRT